MTPVLAVLMFIVWPVVTLAVRVADNAAIGDVLGATRTRDVALFTLVQASISTAVTVLAIDQASNLVSGPKPGA